MSRIKLTTIYWRDIPAQVIAQQGRKRLKQELPKRFAVAIDRAAMRAGRGSSQAYMDEWRRVSLTAKGDLQQLLDDQVAQLETQFPKALLEAAVKAGGIVGSE